MSAAATDLLQQVGLPGTATTLAGSGYSIGGTTMTVGTTTNWPTGTGVSFAVDKVTTVNGVETQVAGSYAEFAGVVTSATTIGSVSLQFGTAQNYPAGATTRVYVPVSSTRENRIVTWGTVQHNQDGTHGAVTATSVSTPALTSTGTLALPNNVVTAPMLATSAITLGYAQYTGPSYSGSTTISAVSGLSVTVTIPAGGRRVKITGYARDIFIGTAGAYAYFSIWDGTVGSGTQLALSQIYSNGGAPSGMVMAVVTPSAGSKTYTIGLQSTAGTPILEASATAPAFILVETI